MPSRRAVLLLVASATACAAPPRVVTVPEARDVPFHRLADELARADVVVFGEVHDSQPVHDAHLQILRELHARRPDLIVSMEMFERDVQPVLDQYLRGDIDEDQFVAAARPWPEYANAYRPVIEFARGKRLDVIAANVPRELARKVAKAGIGEVAGSPHAARETTAPEDEYWAAFQKAMKDHDGTGDAESMRRSYAAQCLKDDTMAESIVDGLRAAYAKGRGPLVVHWCGHFHSDYRRGTVARLLSRSPGLVVKVLSVETVPQADTQAFAIPDAIADYVLVVPGTPEKPAEKPAEKVAAAPVPPPQPRSEPPAGGRPGLGLMPDYEAADVGLRVADVTPGGAAEAAGIKAGDVIVRLGGNAVEDVESYAEALNGLQVGATVQVVLKRDGAEVTLPVVVGTRNR